MDVLSRLKGNFQKEKLSVGLDIGTQAVKCVKLKKSKDNFEVVGFEVLPFSGNLAEALKNIKQSQGIESAAIGVSGPSSVIRFAQFPKMNNDELKKALKFEGQKHLPFSISEINLDGQILKSDLSDNKMLVLIAAVKKDFLTQRIKLVQDAGIKITAVDLDPIALLNAFTFNYPQGESEKHKAVAFLNLGATFTNLAVMEGMLPCFSRDMSIAGNAFTERLAELLSIDSQAAEKIKLGPAQEHKESLVAAAESVLTNLAGEIRTSFDYYESQSSFSVSKIFLSGGASRLPQDKDMLANLLGVEVEGWDPFKKIPAAVSVNAQALKEASAQLMVAVGLALRNQ